MQSVTIKLNFAIICLVLAITNLATVAFWQPWRGLTPTSKVIAVEGSATLKSKPDEYLFAPTFQKTAKTEALAQAALAAITTEVTGKLKALGVGEKDITLNASSYTGSMTPVYGGGSTDPQATASLQIIVHTKEVADNVQVYLATTAVTGSIAPTARFSTAKAGKLEIQARDEAIADAKAKAEQSAKVLGVKLGKVTTYTESAGRGGIITPMYNKTAVSSGGAPEAIPVLTGEQDYTLNLQVSFAIR